MAHGIFDPVVIIDRGIDSRDALIQLNYSVEWKTYPMEHSVHPQELVDLSQFLTQVLQD
jgi:phospholipase/carboxylesterase